MFDLHAHVLPGLDDGPRGIEEALRLLAALAADGITDIVATADLAAPHPSCGPRELHERTRALERLARQSGIPVRLYAAHEVPLGGETEARLADGTALTIADGPYVLLALPPDRLPALVIGTIERLRIKGFMPIVTSVCRYLPAQRDARLMTPLVAAGALLQVSPRMLAGAGGPVLQRTVRALLEAGLVHCFGSGIRGLPAGDAVRYAEGLRIAERLVGAARVREMVANVPQAIVRGLPVRC